MKRELPKKVIPIREDIKADSWKKVRKALKRSYSIANEVRKVAVVPADPSEDIPIKIGSLEFAVKIDRRPTTNNDPSMVYSYDGSGRLQYLDMTIGAVTWRKTIAYDGSGRPDTESVWVAT